MHIDGKNITRLDQTKNVSNKHKADVKTQVHSDTELNQANDFALKQTGMDQQLRLSNDKVTTLQTQKQTLEKGVEKLQRQQDAKGFVDDIKHSGVFAGGDFEQKIQNIASKDSSQIGSVEQAIKSEIENISNRINDEKINARSEAQPEKLIAELQQRLRQNPQTLHQAYANVNSEVVHGLLGNG